MVTMGIFPFQGKTHMIEPGIEPGTSWLVVRSSDHQATRLVSLMKNKFVHLHIIKITTLLLLFTGQHETGVKVYKMKSDV